MRAHPESLAAHVALALFCCLLVGCSSDKTVSFVPTGDPNSGSTTLTGVYAGGGDGGLAQVTVSSPALAAPFHLAPRSASAVNALMTLSPDNGGGAILLSGSYDATADSIHAGGSGYDVRGRSSGSAIVGDYAGPNGPGAWTAAVGSSSTIRSYCGTFQNAGASVSGRSNLMIQGGSVLGIAFYSGGTTAMRLAGTLTGTGNPQQIRFSSSAGDSTLSASGTLNTVTREASGTWALYISGAVADHGTWSAALCRTAGTGTG